MKPPRPLPFLPFLHCLLAFLALSGCTTPGGRQAAGPSPSGPFMRIARPDTDTVRLEIALREFVPRHGKGPVLWLVGVSHLGDTNYYAALQRHLDAQSLVLFEGVDNEDHDLKRKLSARPADGQPVTERASLQTTFARSLGLAFQMDAIDYDRPQFRNSDLTIEQLYALMQRGRTVVTNAGDGAGGPNPLDQLISVMDGSSFLGAAIQTGLRIIGSSAKLQAMTRLALIETLGQFDGNVSEMKAVPPELKELVVVLIEERNKHVVRDVKAALQTTSHRKSVAVFYGAGHMTDLERRLVTELGYRSKRDIWLPAFSVNPRAAGLSAAEVEMVRGLVQWQMQMLQPASRQ
jgi:hypothetical protein